ncbi:anti-sigma factor family protein [Aestuariivirga sp.]|uniref:anti-sigma factor family protein n=1 Tax=Aestuariivirga sp. TaxID=2650926 RepID=UPI00391C525A
MSGTEDIFDSLSAYIDGELDPVETARIAHRIASDEAVARNAARLAEMKSAVAGLLEPVVVLRLPRPRGRKHPLIRPLTAACLVAALASVILASLLLNGQGHRQANAIVEAIARHDAWLESVDLPGTPSFSPAASPTAPDLLAAGLFLAFEHPGLHIDGRPATHTAYVGRNGCRLSLFSLAGGAARESFAISGEEGLLRASWSDGAIDHFLVARAMSEARFAAIVSVLRSGQRRKEEAVAGLDVMRQPCIG